MVCCQVVCLSKKGIYGAESGTVRAPPPKGRSLTLSQAKLPLLLVPLRTHAQKI